MQHFNLSSAIFPRDKNVIKPLKILKVISQAFFGYS